MHFFRFKDYKPHDLFSISAYWYSEWILMELMTPPLNEYTYVPLWSSFTDLCHSIFATCTFPHVKDLS